MTTIFAHTHYRKLESELRDWSLITGRGGGAGLQNGRGACKVLSLQKKGWRAGKVLAMLKGGTTSFGVVFVL